MRHLCTIGFLSAATALAGCPAIDRGVCDEYLECLAEVAPEALAAAEASYAEGGSCWEDQDSAELCRSYCETGLADLGLLYPDEEVCGGDGGDDDDTGDDDTSDDDSSGDDDTGDDDTGDDDTGDDDSSGDDDTGTDDDTGDDDTGGSYTCSDFCAMEGGLCIDWVGSGTTCTDFCTSMMDQSHLDCLELCPPDPTTDKCLCVHTCLEDFL